MRKIASCTLMLNFEEKMVGRINMYFEKNIFLSLLSFSVNGDKDAEEEKEKSLYPPTLCH